MSTDFDPRPAHARPADPSGRIPPGQRVTEKFPVLTAGTPRITPKEEWSFTVEGLVDTPLSFDWKTFNALPMQEFTVDIHCVTRWSKLDTVWHGVSLETLFDAAGVQPEAKYMQAHADGEYSSNLKLEDVTGGQAFIALAFDGKPLTQEHGGPARLVVPKLYFWKSVKWVRGLTLGEWDIKGFWERLGYHNYGDPWREQRYRGLDDAIATKTPSDGLARRIREERLKRDGNLTGPK